MKDTFANEDQFQKDLDKFLIKYNIKTAMLLIQYKNPDHGRFIAVSEDDEVGECEYAELFEKLFNHSSGLRGIIKHTAHHVED